LCPCILFAEVGFPSSGSLEAPAATDSQTILLRDGTKIKGRLIGVQGDTYIVQSPSLGNISLRASDVVSITAQDAPPLPPSDSGSSFSGPSFKAQVEGLQKTMLADPEILTALQELAKDPQFLEMINDPEFTAAVMNYDLEKVRNNPKSQLLMQHPALQNLMQKMKQKYPQP